MEALFGSKPQSLGHQKQSLAIAADLNSTDELKQPAISSPWIGNNFLFQHHKIVISTSPWCMEEYQLVKDDAQTPDIRFTVHLAERAGCRVGYYYLGSSIFQPKWVVKRVSSQRQDERWPR